MTAIFAGTFDPPSFGHLDIIQRSRPLCSELIVAVAEQPPKSTPLFSIEERVTMMEAVSKGIEGVRVVPFKGLLIHLAQELKASWLIRGIRPFADLDREFQMALANRLLSGIETLFLPSDPSLNHISSSLVREIGEWGEGLETFVPESIRPLVYKRLSTSASHGRRSPQ